MKDEKRKRQEEEKLKMAEMDEIEKLRKKLLDGSINAEELARLQELMRKHGLQMS